MTNAARKILIADDDASIRLVLSQAFVRAGFQVRATGSAATLLKWVSDGEGDLVISDVIMPDENFFDVLPRIRKLRPKLPVIVMSAQNTLLTAVSAAETGAFEYLPKPFDLDDMLVISRRALAKPAASEPVQAQARAARDERLPLIGRSAPMQEVYRTLARLVGAELTVLILGESGAGKELAARALHDLGKRRGRQVRGGPFGGNASGAGGIRIIRPQRRDRQAGGCGRRHAVSGRDRRSASGCANPPAQGDRRVGAGHQPEDQPASGRPPDRRHQPGPPRPDPPGAVPGRPLFPLECRPIAAAAPAGAVRGRARPRPAPFSFAPIAKACRPSPWTKGRSTG